MGKIIPVLLLALLFVMFFLPGTLPRLLKKLGLTLRGLGQAADEFTSGEEVPNSPLARYEVQAGEVVRLKVQAQSVRCEDENVVARVRHIGQRIANGSKRREIPYRFEVVEDTEPNAFAVPGGSVFITRSLIDLCGANDDARSDDRLAGVLAHEIAHIELRHAAYQLATRAVVKTGAMILTLGRAALLRQATGHIEELMVKGYSRDNEFAADERGMQLAHAAGYRAAGLAELLDGLRAVQPGNDKPLWQLLQYFQTHPTLEDRIAKLRHLHG